jgi:hypothetical protein
LFFVPITPGIPLLHPGVHKISTKTIVTVLRA